MALGETELLRRRRGNLGRLLHVLANEFQRRVSQRLGARGYGDLRPAHNAVLINVGLQGTRHTDVARRAGITRQAVGQLVEDLTELGYVECVADPSDGRAQLIRFRKRGLAMLEEGMDAIRETQAEYRAILGKRRADELERSLQALAAALEVDMP